MNTRDIIEKLFEHDILITPTQAKLLTEQDALILKDLLRFPKEAEAYLVRLETRTALPPSSSQRPSIIGASPIVHPPSASSTTPHHFSATSLSFPPVQVVKHYEKRPKKRSYQDFVGYFTKRFEQMQRMLRNRKELATAISIDKTRGFVGRNEAVSIIAMVIDKRETKNEHIMLTVEDRSGAINILCSKNKPDLLAFAQETALDEVIGITGKVAEDIIFADSIAIPDIPIQNELKKCPDEVYAVCVSDIHFGNKKFMKPEFDEFLGWLRGERGDEEARRIARLTKYVIVPGDVIEGVGIYPAQEGDLSIHDIYDQYKYCDEVLSSIQTEKHLIIIPGNHDIGRLSEPQPRLPKEVLPKLYARENTYFLSNPSMVRIHQTNNFPGFLIQLYHGGSFIYYGNTIPRLFKEGGVNNPCGIMQYLLQRRHLAPSHSSTLYVPDREEDNLIITEIPDLMITGHLHTTQHRTWRGISMLSCSCWVPITDYQEKQGLKCDPGKFVLINLQTRHITEIKPHDMTGGAMEPTVESSMPAQHPASVKNEGGQTQST